MTTTIAAQNALIELEKFSNAAVNALDLYDVKNDLTLYFFAGQRTISDVIERACEDPDQVNQVRDIVYSTINGIFTDLIKDCNKIVETGIHPLMFNKVILRFDILQDIDTTIHTVVDLSNPQMDEYFSEAKAHAQKAYASSKTSPLWKKFMSPTMFEYYFDIEEKPKESILEDASYFAREDGVVTSLAIEKAQNDTDRKKKVFVSKMDNVLINYRNKKEDLKSLKDLLETDVTNLQLDGYEASRLTDCFIEIWDSVWEGPFDKTKLNMFTEILRHFYLLLTLEKKHLLASKIFSKYKLMGKILPNLENFIDSYQTRLTECLNALPSDHQQINANPEKFEKDKHNLGWFLLATPSTALHQMMTQCITTKGLVPAVVKVCRSIPDLFKLDVVVTCSSPSSKQSEPEPLIISTLKRLIAIGRTQWTTSAEWDNMAYLAMAFTKSRKVKAEGADDNNPLLESFELIQLSKQEILNKQSPIAVETFVKLLNRLLANNSNNKTNANFNFSTTFKQSNLTRNVIAAPELIHLLFETMVEYDTLPGETSEYCREALKSLGGRLNDANVQFSKTTCDFFESRSFNNCAWWVKYAIFSWYSEVLNRPKLQIPSGLYLSLPDAVKDRFSRIATSEQSNAAECYLKSLFELGLYDIDLAVNQLKFGYDRRLEDADCLEKIALALVDCFGKRLAKKREGNDIARLIKEMLDILEPSKSFKKLQLWSASMYEAIKDIDYLSVLSRAVKIAFEKQSLFSFRDTTGISEKAFDEILLPAEVAQHLISIYCHAARRHIETEIEETTHLRSETRRVIFESTDPDNQGWKLKMKLERKESKLLQQLTTIFNESCSFTRLMRETPLPLQQLLTLIAQQILQVQDMATNRALDEVLTEKTKHELVYVFANQLPPPTTASTSTPAPQKVESMRNVASTSMENHHHHHYQQQQQQPVAHIAPQPHTSNSTYAENSMFNGGGGHRYHHHHHHHNNNYQSNSSSSNRLQSEEENPPRSQRGYGTVTARGGGTIGYSRPPRYYQNKRTMDPHNMAPGDRQEFMNRSRKPRNGGNGSGSSTHSEKQPQFESASSDHEYVQNVNALYESYDNYQSVHDTSDRSSPKSRNRRDSVNSLLSESTQAAINNLTHEKLQAAMTRAANEKVQKQSRPYVGRGGGRGGGGRTY